MYKITSESRKVFDAITILSLNQLSSLLVKLFVIIGGGVDTIKMSFLFFSADTVAEGILQLIADTSQSGAVMTATLAKGLKYQKLFGDPQDRIQAKL